MGNEPKLSHLKGGLMTPRDILYKMFIVYLKRN